MLFLYSKYNMLNCQEGICALWPKMCVRRPIVLSAAISTLDRASGGRPFSEHQCIGVALAAPDPEHRIVGTRPLVEAFRDRRDKRLALESFDFTPAHREQEGLYPPP